eukprot:scaffold82091_cov57-Phaeocystis_antarctica.AAC.4
MLKVLLVLGLQLSAAEVSLASSSSTSLPASLAAPEAGRSRERSQLRHLQARRNASSSCAPVCSSGGCMPQIYLIGAQKAGSSSMFSILMRVAGQLELWEQYARFLSQGDAPAVR